MPNQAGYLPQRIRYVTWERAGPDKLQIAITTLIVIAAGLAFFLKFR